MALTDEGMSTTMLVSPSGACGSNGGGFGNGFGQDGWWIILLLLLVAGGWNNGGFGGGNFGGSTSYVPYVNNDVQRGFDQSSIMGGINGINAGVQNLATQLCNCCCDVRETVNSGFATAEISNNARQMANMNQIYGLSTQLADCCCENRLGLANLGNSILSESFSNRVAVADGVREIVTASSNNTQKILDQLCQDKIDAKNEKIADLERQLTMANLNASQIAQTAQIQRGQTAEVDALYDRLKNCPVPSMPVYGMQPIFTCGQTQSSCGCGCNSGF